MMRTITTLDWTCGWWGQNLSGLTTKVKLLLEKLCTPIHQNARKVQYTFNRTNIHQREKECTKMHHECTKTRMQDKNSRTLEKAEDIPSAPGKVWHIFLDLRMEVNDYLTLFVSQKSPQPRHPHRYEIFYLTIPITSMTLFTPAPCPLKSEALIR